MELLVFAFAFFAGMALVQGIYTLISARTEGWELQMALEALRGGDLTQAGFATSTRKKADLRILVERLIERLKPYGSKAAAEDTEQRLIWAGLKMDVDRFGAIRLLCGAGGALAGLVLLGPMWGSFIGALIFGLVGGFLGWLGPDLWLTSKVNQRHRTISKELPTFVTFLASAVAANLPLAEALRQVQERLPGVLSDVVSVALRAPQVGQTLEEGLEQVANRLGHPDVKQVFRQIIRSQETGTPLVRELRSIGQTLQVQRRERAKEVGNRLSVSMIFPLIIFILPVILLFLGFPAMTTLLNSLLSAQ